MNTPPSPDPSCSGSAMGLLIRQVRDGLWARLEHELTRSGHDLTFSQFVTLKKLANGMASVTDLARAAELNPGAMTRLLDKLEARGLLVRVADPADRRALHIHLTDEGRRIWSEVDQCGQRVRKAALAGFDDAETQQFIRMLERTRDNLSNPET